MTARIRSRRLTRSLLAGSLACSLLTAGASLAAACGLASAARPQARPAPAVLTADRLAVRGSSAWPVAPAGAAADGAAGKPRSMAAAGTAQTAGGLVVGGCAFWDISCEMDSWISGLIVSALKPLLGIVAQTGLSTPDPTILPAVNGMWDGSAGVADAMFVLLILAGGMILMGYQTYQSSYAVKEVAPRLVIAMVAANASLLFIPKAISLSNAMSTALAPGLSQRSATKTLASILASGDTSSGIFLLLLSLVAVALAAVVAVTYVIRLMAVVMLTGAAPLALACYALPHTSWAARWWWRAFAAVLIIPDAQALVLAAAVKVFFSPGWAGFGTNGAGTSPYLLNILITICLLYVMMRIPFWISRPALQPFGPSPIRRTLRYAFGAAVLSRASRALRGTSSTAAVTARRNGSGRQRGAGQQHRTGGASLRGSAARGITPGRGGAPPAGAPGSGAGTGGSPAPPGGGSAAQRQAVPLPDGGTGHRARHALPLPLPYADGRAGRPPLPGDASRRRPVPPLPGGSTRRNAQPPLPGGPARRSAQPPLPGGPARRSARPSLPGGPARRSPVPPLPGGSARSSAVPPPPGGPARRSAPPPLPGGSALRSARPPLPGGPARRNAVPPLPVIARPTPGPRPGLPSAGLPVSGLHAKPPPLPGDGQQVARARRMASTPPRDPPPVGQPHAVPRSSTEPRTRAASRPKPRQNQSDHGRKRATPRRGEEKR